MNNIMINGRIAFDLELKNSAGGSSYLKNKIIHNKRVKKGDTWADEAHSFDIIAFGNEANFISKYFTKGQEVCIGGELQASQWTDKDGKKQYGVSILIKDIFAGQKPRNTQKPQQSHTGGASFSKTQEPSLKEQRGVDEIPF